MTKVSIILPNFNHSKYLSQRIDSILNQTYQNFELIILDDCSTDNSRDILNTLKGHPKVSHIEYNSINSGTTFKQWQKGILLAKGEYIWIAESDDWAEYNFLEEMVKLVEETHNVGIAFCGSHWADMNGEIGADLSIYHGNFKRSGKEEIKKHLVKYNTIQNASAVLLNAAMAKKHSFGIEQFKSSGDWFFYINILQESNLVFISKKLNYFRWYHNNTSQKASKNGSWIMEGLTILKRSAASKNKYSLRQAVSIFRFWQLKINNAELKKIKFWLSLIIATIIFTVKNITFKILKY